MKQSRHGVYIRTGQKNSANWSLHLRSKTCWRDIHSSGSARSTIRTQLGRGCDLRSEVWRSAKKKPPFGVCGKSQLGLAARAAVKFPGSQPLAIGTSTIPLGKTSPGCGAEDFYAHSNRIRADREAVIALQLSVGVGTDFAAEVNLFVLRCGPVHGKLLELKTK